MKVYRSSRRAAALAATAAAAVLATASPAAADATVSPATAPQGTGANITFRVVNEHRTAAITRLRLVLPTATPIAEVYPLSVPNWAPQITARTIDPPMLSAHGSPVTQATASITWTAAKGKALAPGRTAKLMIAIGPLPMTEQMSFELVPTYADGSTAPAIEPAVLRLSPGGALAAAPGSHGGATAHEETIVDTRSLPVREDGPGVMNLIGWLIALVTGAAGVVLLLRSRRSPGSARTTATPPVPAQVVKTRTSTVDVTNIKQAKPKADDGGTAPAATSPARVSAWSYRDGP